MGMAGIATSRFVFGDHLDDSEGILTNAISSLDGASTGGVSVVVEGTGPANVSAGSQLGTLVLAVRNIPELRDYLNGQALILWKTVSFQGT